jgi:3-methyladenine DNA glycosylase AlkD
MKRRDARTASDRSASAKRNARAPAGGSKLAADGVAEFARDGVAEFARDGVAEFASERVAEFASELDAALRKLGTPARAEQERRYLKSSLEHYGVTMPSLRRTARAFRRAQPELTHDALLALVTELWRVPVHERRMLALCLLEQYASLLVAQDIKLLERLLRESHGWALVDGLASGSVGRLVQRFPALRSTLDRWSRDADFWMRRSALLALLPGLRRGSADFARFSRYADLMLDEKEFFVRKAIGWVLRETSKHSPNDVAAWLGPRIGRVSGVTLREALKYLPSISQRKLSEAYRARPKSLRRSH